MMSDVIVQMIIPSDRNLVNNNIDESILRFNDCINSEVDRHSEEIEIKSRRFVIPEHIKKLFQIKYT